MAFQNRHIVKSISSSIDISGSPETIWVNITNVRIEQLSDPTFFRILGIPRPLKADLLTEGEGGKRIEAVFPFIQFACSANPESISKVSIVFNQKEQRIKWKASSLQKQKK